MASLLKKKLESFSSSEQEQEQENSPKIKSPHQTEPAFHDIDYEKRQMILSQLSSLNFGWMKITQNVLTNETKNILRPSSIRIKKKQTKKLEIEKIQRRFQKKSPSVPHTFKFNHPTQGSETSQPPIKLHLLCRIAQIRVPKKKHVFINSSRKMTDVSPVQNSSRSIFSEKERKSNKIVQKKMPSITNGQMKNQQRRKSCYCMQCGKMNQFQQLHEDLIGEIKALRDKRNLQKLGTSQFSDRNLYDSTNKDEINEDELYIEQEEQKFKKKNIIILKPFSLIRSNFGKKKSIDLFTDCSNSPIIQGQQKFYQLTIVKSNSLPRKKEDYYNSYLERAKDNVRLEKKMFINRSNQFIKKVLSEKDNQKAKRSGHLMNSGQCSPSISQIQINFEENQRFRTSDYTGQIKTKSLQDIYIPLQCRGKINRYIPIGRITKHEFRTKK